MRFDTRFFKLLGPGVTLLLVIMLIANNRTIMGTHVNGPLLNVLGWTTTAIMFAASVAFVLA